MLIDGLFAALKEKEILLESLMVSSNFKPKNSPFWTFFKGKKSLKFTNLVVLVAKNHKNLHKIQKSIFIS